MNNKSFRIRTTPGGNDKYIKLKLDQEYDFLEVMSLKIQQKDIYRSFSADYGCVVGRVIASDVGIENAKVSVFIPISEEDEKRPEILRHYPFKTPRDKDKNGVRYNLLPRLSILDRFTGWIHNRFGIGYKPKTPVGTFPSKAELLTDDTFIEVYDKYYKFTTVTNSSGDFMLMGVPLGRQTLHVDVDITDIGRFSMKTVTMQKKLGFPASLFTKSNRIKYNKDLSKVPSIYSMDLDVDVKPFWGNSEEQEIGITRQDFNINAELHPSFVLFGSNFTMSKNRWWGDYVVMRATFGLKGFQHTLLKRPKVVLKFCKFNIFPFVKKIDDINTDLPIDSGNNNLSYSVLYGGEYDLPAFYLEWKGTINCGSMAPNRLDTNDGLDIRNHRTGKIDIDHFYFPEGVDSISTIEEVNNKIKKLEKVEYYELVENGAFAQVIYCNRRKKYTNEFGELVDSNDPNVGVFTEYKGYMLAGMPDLSIDNPPTTRRTERVKMKIPQTVDYYDSERLRNIDWFNETHTFEYGKTYSVSQLIKDEAPATPNDDDIKLWYSDRKGEQDNWDQNVGHIRDVISGDMFPNIKAYGAIVDNEQTYEYCFGNEWLNFSLYFLQYMYRSKKGGFLGIGKVSSDEVWEGIVNKLRVGDNNEPIGPNMMNNKGYNRGDRFQTQFIEVPNKDLVLIADKPYKGFATGSNITLPQRVRGAGIIEGLEGKYWGGENNISHGQIPSTGNKYFYRGLGSSDCIRLLIENNLI